jgi:hypothetical protein
MVHRPTQISKPKAALIFSALIGVGIISIVQITSVTALSKSLRVAVFCFSISIPFLAAVLYILVHLDDDVVVYIPNYFRFIYLNGILFSFAGIAAIFFHFHRVFGIIFILASMLASFCGFAFLRRLVRAHAGDA